jgi:hypothetical protein
MPGPEGVKIVARRAGVTVRQPRTNYREIWGWGGSQLRSGLLVAQIQGFPAVFSEKEYLEELSEGPVATLPGGQNGP